MAESRTAKKRIKKLAHKIAEEQVIDELLTTYLNWWTRQEIQNLVSKGTLLLLPAEHGTGYIIGQFTLKQQEGYWVAVNQSNDVTLTFYDKLASIFYCLFEYRKMYRKSAELWNCDSKLRKLDNDQKLYRHKYKIACEQKNSFAQDLWQARLSDVTPQLMHTQEQLQKMINWAKYIKIWD